MKATSVLLWLCGSSFAAAPAAAQHIIGGGDPLMMIFSEAQYESARILENLDPASMPFGALDVRTWLGATVAYEAAFMPRHQAMALEMTKSTHAWKEGDVGFNKCAVIPLDPAVEPRIELSLSRCRPMLALSASGGAEAVKTLIHEIGHRFALGTTDADEAFASAVAVAVFKTWKSYRQSGTPFWLGIGDGGLFSERYQASSVWTGAGTGPTNNQLLVWGGCNDHPIRGSSICANYLNSGARLVYARDTRAGELAPTVWQAMNTEGAPTGRKLHSAVWTGETKEAAVRRKMIVFGGCRGDDTACDQSFSVTPNSLYDAESDRWLPLAASGAPSPRVFHGAAWTSHDEMIVWGGLENYQIPTADRILGDGGILSFPRGKPEGEWRPMPLDGAPAARYGHTGIWTGTEFVVFGGCGQEPGVTRCLKPLNDGAFFDPYPRDGMPHWRALPGDAAVPPRTNHSAIWTGRHLIVWGGLNGARVLQGGARYDAVDKVWRPLNPTLPNGELGRRDHVAVYEPLQGRMIIWGGVAPDGTYPTRTLIYDIENDVWSYAGTTTDPTGREGHVAAWIQDSLFVWGGFHRTQGSLAEGGIFNP